MPNTIFRCVHTFFGNFSIEFFSKMATNNNKQKYYRKPLNETNKLLSRCNTEIVILGLVKMPQIKSLKEFNEHLKLFVFSVHRKKK